MTAEQELAYEQLIKNCCASVDVDYRRMLPPDYKKTLGSLFEFLLLLHLNITKTKNKKIRL